ncbi:hypothetical protein KDD93_07515 [Campylobacter sp. faydin G-24]|uniref:Uncharacterized protein n=1 Tax=Campylobacter anatolicus TaxID=2829105 RepID=A0ABS5HJF9_9BACT|nr:hypothetical protein [Campylobacter anatolicus]MBR8464410.1 hypothetical protein [Campylobacter anatolicus]
MTRLEIIKQALNINEVQALITAELIKPLRDEDLIPFFAFRTNFIQPRQSNELITKNAVFAYRKQKALKLIEQGDFRFDSIEALVDFVKMFFKNELLCYGPDTFYDSVIIGVDDKGNLVSKYTLKELNSEETASVYEWLFNNQERIGVIKYISQTQVNKQIRAKEQEAIPEIIDPDAPLKIDPKVGKLLENFKAKRVINAGQSNEVKG